MPEINQHRVAWTGARGLPGVNTFYSTGSPGALNGKLATFYNAIKAYIPNSVVITIPNTGMILDEATGFATAVWATGSVVTVNGTHSGAYAAPSGFLVNFNTSLFVAGRRLRGKAYMVPAGVAIYDSDGSIGATQMPILNSAAAPLAGGTDPLVVWSRKTGQSAPVTDATVPDKVVVMRSRRD